MFFVSLSTTAGIFTSFSHEISLWCSATWPTVFTQSREDYYRGIADNSPSPHPPVPFVPATGLSVVTRRPLDNSRCHLAVIPKFIQQSADLDNCTGSCFSVLMVTAKLLCYLSRQAHFALPLSGKEGDEETSGVVNSCTTPEQSQERTNQVLSGCHYCAPHIKLLICSYSGQWVLLSKRLFYR